MMGSALENSITQLENMKLLDSFWILKWLYI